MFVEKKNPYKFTIGFKKQLESHRRAADILNQTPDKADLITAAILNYYGEDAREGIYNLDSLRPWIEEVIQREVLSVMKKMPDPDKEMISVERESQDNIKAMDLSEDHEDEFSEDEFEIDITRLMDSFRL